MRVEVRIYDVYTRDKGKIVTVHAIKHYRKSRITAPHVFNLDCRWSSRANFTNPATLSSGKNPVTFELKVEWDAQPVWKIWRR
jgi:hypothetical protein